MASESVIWTKWGLLLTDKHLPHTNVHNAALILEQDPDFAGTVYYDEFLQRIMRRNSPVREWRDGDDLELLRHIQNNIRIPRMSRESVTQAVVAVASKDRRNCVVEWLDSLKWDGTPRIDQFFSDAFGAEVSEYTTAASRNFWLSLAARVYQPGCKVDNMIVLEGSQGVGKSTAMDIVGGDYFAEQHESATNPKAFAEILQGKLLVEISEMDAFSRSEVNRVKQTVSCRSDRFRASYGRHAADHPRTCIFVGTTNRDDWNRDETGARRFWPIKCNEINLDVITQNREQLFAEAVARHKAGEPHWLMPEQETKDEQEARYQSDPWHDQIALALKGVDNITTAQIAEQLGVPVERRDKWMETRIGAAVKFLGWERKRRRIDGKLTWYYRPTRKTVGTVGTVGTDNLF